MHPILQLLAGNPLLLLFTVIGIGFLVGSIKLGGFSLGVAAVLFVGMAFGAVDRRLDLPEYIYVLGLVLFVYTIGLQSGPGFFASFQKRGFRTNLFAVLMIGSGALAALTVRAALGLSAPSTVGLFCGALTNTPALAATVETVKQMTTDLPRETAELYANSPVVTFGLAYPFGVLGGILWFYVFSKLLRVDFVKEMRETAPDTIVSRTFRVTNPAVVGKRVDEVLRYMDRPGFVLSRIRKGGITSIVTPDTVFATDDLIVVVGVAGGIERARLLFGEVSAEHLAIDEGHVDDFIYGRIFVSDKAVVGKTVAEIDLQKRFDATITRLRRGDVDFVPSESTVLELGDRIRVVTRRENLDRITRFFGDSLRAVSETDFLPLSLGILIGVFVGMAPIPLPNGSVFRLGFAGGPLVAALLLGRLQRSGPITWTIPYSANIVLRQIGLVFFLAAIGTKAGHGFTETFRAGGWGLIVGGAAITTSVSVGALLVGYKLLKLPMSAVMGMVSGMQTQPACLAYANQQARNELPNIWYAAVYPASMIAKILLAQILVSVLL